MCIVHVPDAHHFGRHVHSIVALQASAPALYICTVHVLGAHRLGGHVEQFAQRGRQKRRWLPKAFAAKPRYQRGHIPYTMSGEPVPRSAEPVLSGKERFALVHAAVGVAAKVH